MAVCGIAGGVLTWVAVDKLIVEIDEHFNREKFEQELRSMLDEQKKEIKEGLKNAYATLLTKIADEQKFKLKSGVDTPIKRIYN